MYWVSVVLSAGSRKLSAVCWNWSARICHLLPFLNALMVPLDIRSRIPRSLRLSLVATSETLKYFLSILAVNGSSRQSVTVKSLLAIGDVVGEDNSQGGVLDQVVQDAVAVAVLARVQLAVAVFVFVVEPSPDAVPDQVDRFLESELTVLARGDDQRDVVGGR